MSIFRRHPISDEALNAYVDGALPAADAARVHAHLDACAACRDAVAELRAVRSALASLPRASAPRSFAVRPGAVEAAPAAPAWWRRLGSPALGGLATAAAVAFVALVFIDAGTDGGNGSNRVVPLSYEASGDVAEDGDGGEAPSDAAPGAQDVARDPAAPDVAPDDGSAASRSDADGDAQDDAGDAFVPEEEQPAVERPAAAPDDDDDTALRAAEAGTAALAVIAGIGAFVLWRRRT